MRFASFLIVVTLVSACAVTGSTVREEFEVVPAPTSEPPVTTLAQTTTAPATTSTTVPDRFEITVTGGEVTGAERISVPLGARITLVISSDIADEAHLHGYDLHAEVGPGTDGELVFDATIPGIFELELEESGLVLTEVEVS